MAKPAANRGETNVTRIKASDSKPSAVKKTKAASTPKKATKTKVVKATRTDTAPGRRNVFARIWTYFKGAWTELRLVRWPDRKATWGMTGALLVFTIFFIVIIVVLDFAFSQLFKLILGSN